MVVNRIDPAAELPVATFCKSIDEFVDIPNCAIFIPKVNDDINSINHTPKGIYCVLITVGILAGILKFVPNTHEFIYPICESNSIGYVYSGVIGIVKLDPYMFNASLPSRPSLPGLPLIPLNPILPLLPSLPAGPDGPGIPSIPAGPGGPGGPILEQDVVNDCDLICKDLRIFLDILTVFGFKTPWGNIDGGGHNLLVPWGR